MSDAKTGAVQLVGTKNTSKHSQKKT